MEQKIYGVYLAYSAREVYPSDVASEMEEYPSKIARIRKFNNPTNQLECYANTICPASQLIEADSEKEFNEKVEQMKKNFSNREWLEKNIYPYI